MKTGKLIINNTTLHPPDEDGEVQIAITEQGFNGYVEYVSFESLEKWVASIRQQIIPNATDACNVTNCKYAKNGACSFVIPCPEEMRR